MVNIHNVVRRLGGDNVQSGRRVETPRKNDDLSPYSG